MTTADRLNEIEARANAATDGPWATVAEDGAILSLVLTDENDGLFYGDSGYDAPITTETGDDAEFIAHARTDVPDLVAALRAVLDLHREARNDVDRTPPCPHCHGEPGVHECGCWADEKWPTVCAVCMEGTKGASVAWPCPTVRAIEEALS